MFETTPVPDSPRKSTAMAHRWLLRRRELLVAVTLVGLTMSLVLGWLFSKREHQFLEMQFSVCAEDRVQALKTALADRAAILKFVSSFYTGSDEVERREFRSFMQPVLTENADIEFLGWAPRLPGDLRADFENQMQQEGFADCQVRQVGGDGKLRPADKRNEYYPLEFVESLGNFSQLLGFDLSSDPAARAAIDRVNATKLSTVAQCNLPNSNGVPTKMLCLFEYAQSAPPAPGETKITRRLNRGVVVSAIRLRMLLEEAVESFPRVGVNMYFFEETAPGKTSLLLARPSRLEKNPLPPLEQLPTTIQDIHHFSQLSIADRTWPVYCVPVDSYKQIKGSWEPFSAVMVGLLATGVLVSYLFLLTGRQEEVESLVRLRTEALHASQQRFRRLIDGAGDAFFLHDAQGQILDVNERACQCLGYTRQELLKMNVTDIDAQPYKVDQKILPWNLPDADYPLTFEGAHRRKNGETFPVEVRLTFHDHAGQRWLLGLARDITERKQAEASLKAEQRLLRQLLELMENDRKLVAYEIHDGLAQLLTGLWLQLQAMQALNQQQDPAAWKNLPRTLELANLCNQEVRRLIGGLRPPVLDESGVVAAIEYLVGEKRRTESAEIVFHHKVQFQQLASPLEAALFRIAQESLTNACRYSQSDKIEIDLMQCDGTLELKIQDWGVGFDTQQIGGQHLGLRGIRERARLLGGTAEIVSAKNQGTTVTVQLPLVERAIEESNEP